jgi:hypothetical protein
MVSVAAGEIGFLQPALQAWKARYQTEFPTAPTSEQEKQVLKQEVQRLRDSLDSVNKRIEELEK